MHDFLGLGIGLGRFIVILVFGYFTIKWAVKNGIRDAYEEITGKEVKDDLDEILEKEEQEKNNK